MFNCPHRQSVCPKGHGFQLFQHAKPALCPFIFGQPHTQQFFPACGVDTQRQENNLVYHAAILTDFNDNTVHINNGIQPLQLPILPLGDLLFYSIGDLRCQCG